MSNCRTCHAEIIWAITESGKRIPLDTTPFPNGNIVIDEGQQGEKYARYLHKDETANQWRYRSHFVSCPDAASHRRNQEAGRA